VLDADERTAAVAAAAVEIVPRPGRLIRDPDHVLAGRQVGREFDDRRLVLGRDDVPLAQEAVEGGGIDDQARGAADDRFEAAELYPDPVLAGRVGGEFLHGARVAADGDARPDVEADLVGESEFLHLLAVPPAAVIRGPAGDLLLRRLVGQRLR